VPGLVGSAGNRSDDEYPDPIGPGEHAAPFAWPDANQRVAFERKVLAPDSSSSTPLPSSAMYISSWPSSAWSCQGWPVEYCGRSIVCTPKLVQPELGADLSHRPPKGGLHLIEALTRRVCHRVLPLIVLWWCRFAAPAGRLGPGWCNLSKGCSRMCSLPTWWPCSSARRSARLRPRRSTTTPTPSKPLLGAPGCDRASESCRVVQ
jgi:hypothetical protein